jgi:hypothetical protein
VIKTKGEKKEPWELIPMEAVKNSIELLLTKRKISREDLTGKNHF